MRKVLSQKEIDALIRASQGGKSVPSTQPAVTPWDGRLAGQISQEQMQAISRLHETFARNLTHSLGAYLRIQFEAKMVSGEHLTYAEFLQSIPEVTYLASCRLEPIAASAVLQLDLTAAYPLIDVLLGGEGTGVALERSITEIEEQILETVMRMICRELQRAWQSLSLEFRFEQRQHLGQVEQLMPSAEKILLLSFEITVQESRGTLNVVVPALVSYALLRKISERTAARPRLRPDSENRVRSRLLSCPFVAELAMLRLRVPLRSLAALAPGTVLGLGRGAEQPATLLVAGVELFTARLAKRGFLRAAQVLAPNQKPDSAASRSL